MIESFIKMYYFKKACDVVQCHIILEGLIDIRGIKGQP